MLTKATASSNSIGPESSQKFDILVTTPARLMHMVETDSIKLDHVQWLVFDEADKLFDAMFLEQVDSIIAACRSPQIKIALFSATLIPVVEEAARSVQRDPIRIVIGAKNAATSTIKQELLFVGFEEGKLLAMHNLVQAGKLRPPVLIFVQSKERAQQLFHELIYDGINVDVIHSDRTQAQRNLTVEKFRTGEIWVLITTDLMARGMDFKGVNLVINFDFPQSVTTYIHRIGRTGRAGRSGEAITFYTEADFEQLRSIVNVMKESGCDNIPQWMLDSLTKPNKKKRKALEKRPIERAAIEHVTYFKKHVKKKKKGPQSQKNTEGQPSAAT